MIILLIAAAISIPLLETAIKSYRAGADASAVASQLALARMRAAADFTRVEVVFDAANGNYELEVLNTSTGAYQLEGGVQYLSSGSSFTFGTISAPAGGQTTIQQTSPIIFNSRGLPVDSTGAPTATDAIYVASNGNNYAVSVSVTGEIRVWQYSHSAWTQR